MRATVKFCGSLPAILGLPRAEIVVEVAPGCTVFEVMRAVDIPDDVALAYSVNCKMRTRDHEVRDGDHIAAIHPLAGG